MDEKGINIVIPLGKGSVWDDNNELRYCLRSIEKYAINYKNIIIIGEYPNWIKNVIHIPCQDDGNIISKNILYKILKYTQSDLFLDDYFILFNDDYFLTKELNCKTYPLYYSKDLKEAASIRPENEDYNEYLYSTRKVLSSQGLNTRNYDIHYPLIINKSIFNKVYNKFKLFWDINTKLLIKSTYCNYMQDKSFDKEIEDCKIRGQVHVNDFSSLAYSSYDAIQKGMFSTGDLILNNNEIRNEIRFLYPDESKYEI